MESVRNFDRVFWAVTSLASVSKKSKASSPNLTGLVVDSGEGGVERVGCRDEIPCGCQPKNRGWDFSPQNGW